MCDKPTLWSKRLCSNCATESKRLPAVFREKRYSYFYWRDKIARELQQIAAQEAAPKVADQLERRAWALGRCGNLTRARACAECKTTRLGSGRVDLRAGTLRPCRTRACAFCNRIRAQTQAKDLVEAIRAMPKVQGYRWKLLTFTCEYKPWDPDHVTWFALRQRYVGVLSGFKAAWKTVLSQRERPHKRCPGRMVLEEIPGVAAFYKAELAGTGNVHLHVLYYGPFVHKGTFETAALRLRAAAKEGYDSAGWVDIKTAERRARYEGPTGRVLQKLERSKPEAFRAALTDGLSKCEGPGDIKGTLHCGHRVVSRWLERYEWAREALDAEPPGSENGEPDRGAVAEVAKYTAKMPGPRSVAWLSGWQRDVVDPVLMARWERALLNLRDRGTLGALYHVQLADEAPSETDEDADQEQEPAEDHDVKCTRCGFVGWWQDVLLSTPSYLADCRAAGVVAWGQDAGRWGLVDGRRPNWDP